MEISTELRDRVLSECKKMLPRAEEVILGKKFTTRFVEIPIMIDGVMDSIRYNVEEKRFDRITVWIAAEGIGHRLPMSKNAVYCAKAKIVHIDLEKDNG